MKREHMHMIKILIFLIKTHFTSIRPHLHSNWFQSFYSTHLKRIQIKHQSKGHSQHHPDHTSAHTTTQYEHSGQPLAEGFTSAVADFSCILVCASYWAICRYEETDVYCRQARMLQRTLRRKPAVCHAWVTREKGQLGNWTQNISAVPEEARALLLLAGWQAVYHHSII